MHHLRPLNFISVLYGLLGITYFLYIHTADPTNKATNSNKISSLVYLFFIEYHKKGFAFYNTIHSFLFTTALLLPRFHKSILLCKPEHLLHIALLLYFQVYKGTISIKLCNQFWLHKSAIWG